MVPAVLPAQQTFAPLDMSRLGTAPDRASARADWVRITNQRLEMQGKAMRVATADAGSTAVLLVRDVSKPRQARPILLGKGEYASLIQAMPALGFNRVVVRNPDTLQEWGARLEPGRKPDLE